MQHTTHISSLHLAAQLEAADDARLRRPAHADDAGGAGDFHVVVVLVEEPDKKQIAVDRHSRARAGARPPTPQEYLPALAADAAEQVEVALLDVPRAGKARGPGHRL